MRNYIVASWNDADQYDYSGEMLGGSRHQGRSQKVHFNADGSACVASYGDPEVKTAKVSIKDKILPQAKRLTTLREQMIELETSYRAGEMDISEYSLYRDIIIAKIQRQEVLYKRAASVKPKSSETDEDSAQDSAEYTPSSGFSPQPDDGYASEELEEIGVIWVDELSETNSLKNILKKACVVCRTLVKWHQAARNYYTTLKAV